MSKPEIPPCPACGGRGEWNDSIKQVSCCTEDCLGYMSLRIWLRLSLAVQAAEARREWNKPRVFDGMRPELARKYQQAEAAYAACKAKEVKDADG